MTVAHGAPAPSRYITRAIDARLERVLAELPAVMLTGPRATGKTTTARRHARTVVRLDREQEATAFRDDPDSALRHLPEPVLLDEWQLAPGVLGAVKRAIDDGAGAGRFLLTGSVHAELTGEMWPGTGRIVPLRMYGLTERELAGTAGRTPFLRRLIDAIDDPHSFPMPSDRPDLRGYVELALRGGFPDPVLRSSRVGAAEWLEGYVTQLVSRDVRLLAEPRDPHLLRAYFEAVALNTAGLPQHKTLYEAVGIDRKTAVAFDRLLVNLFVLEQLPAWSSNRLERLVHAAKRYVVDPALAAAALDIDTDAVMRDGDLLGRLIDTFALAQLRPETQLEPRAPRLHHLRDRNGRHEIDLVAEVGRGEIVALEIKSTAAPTPGDARHVEWLREALGDRFRAGAVLHTGQRPFRLTEHVAALPICALWGPDGAT